MKNFIKKIKNEKLFIKKIIKFIMILKMKMKLVF